MKKPFVTKAQLDGIVKSYPTPFHLYDEAGLRANARRVNAAFAWNPGFREYFAVTATPNPSLLKIFREEGCGADCSSLTEPFGINFANCARLRDSLRELGRYCASLQTRKEWRKFL